MFSFVCASCYSFSPLLPLSDLITAGKHEHTNKQTTQFIREKKKKNARERAERGKRREEGGITNGRTNGRCQWEYNMKVRILR